MQRKRGFTLIELLVVIAIIALLIGLLLPALARAQQNARTLRDKTQIKQIHQSMLIFAERSNGRLPLPGLIWRLPDPWTTLVLPDRGPEDVAKNHSANLFSACIAQNLFNTDIVIGPTEVSEVVKEDADYKYNLYRPGAPTPTFWDTAFLANLVNGSNTSYFHASLCGRRKDIKWRNDQEASFPMLSTRGVLNGDNSGQNYNKSITLQLHDPEGSWSGNVVFGDNHAETLNSFYPALTSYSPQNATSAQRDNIFKAEFTGADGGEAAGDAYCTMSTASSDTEVTETWDPLLQ